MNRVELSTIIERPIREVFDAARDVTFHLNTQSHRQERVVGGVTSGLLDLNDEVEWEAVHFGVTQRLRVRLTDLETPLYFRDEMISGAFKSFSHEHHFEALAPSQTRMRDILYFAAPLGLFGWLADHVFLASYLRRFLLRKNAAFKRLIESA